MTSKHASFQDNLPAFALGTLDAEEAAALQEHLRTCEACPRELAEFQAASEPLLFAAAAHTPRAEVRRNLARQLPRASRRAASAPRQQWAFAPAFTAVALVLLLAMNVISLSQVGALQEQQTALASELQAGQAALALVASPRSHAVAGQGEAATGSLVMNPESMQAVLILSDLPALQQGQTFQIWLVEPGGGRVSAGLFEGAEGAPVTVASLSTTDNIYDFAGVGVTIEPEGGSPAPSGPRVFLVEF